MKKILDSIYKEIVVCLTCNKETVEFKANKKKYCSQLCYWNHLKSTKPFLGKKHSENAKKKMSEFFKGKRMSIRTEFKKGQKHTEEWKEHMRKLRLEGKLKNPPIRKGADNNRWRGGVTPANEKDRKSKEYKIWRKLVFERDNYQCVIGGKDHGSKLNADHIKEFCNYPDLRFDIDNGRTLCINCHKKITNEQLKTIWKNQYIK